MRYKFYPSLDWLIFSRRLKLPYYTFRDIFSFSRFHSLNVTVEEDDPCILFLFILRGLLGRFFYVYRVFFDFASKAIQPFMYPMSLAVVFWFYDHATRFCLIYRALVGNLKCSDDEGVCFLLPFASVRIMLYPNIHVDEEILIKTCIMVL